MDLVSMYKFASCDRNETIIYGAAKPKYTEKAVDKWIEFMQTKEIKRVCCLLPRDRLNFYRVDLLKTYSQNFGEKRILWQPLQDFEIPRSQILINSIIPFFISAEEQQEKTVVHCSFIYT